MDDSISSIYILFRDIKEIVENIWNGEDESPQILLVGHSMGGAIAIHTAHLNYIKNLIGLVVIDVVEGSAMDALSSMQSFLQGRPKYFDSIEKAIEYSVRSGQIRNSESARVSMLGQLKKESVTSNKEANYQSLGSQSHSVMQTDLMEEEEEEDNVPLSSRSSTLQTSNQGNDASFKVPEV